MSLALINKLGLNIRTQNKNLMKRVLSNTKKLLKGNEKQMHAHFIVK